MQPVEICRVPPSRLTGTFFDLKIEEFQRVLELNLTGIVLPTRVFLKPMVEQKAGAIVNFSRMAAFRPMTRVAGYAAANKPAISNFTAFMATEVAKKFGEGIRVNAIAPGFLLTTRTVPAHQPRDGWLHRNVGKDHHPPTLPSDVWAVPKSFAEPSNTSSVMLPALSPGHSRWWTAVSTHSPSDEIRESMPK